MFSYNTSMLTRYETTYSWLRFSSTLHDLTSDRSLPHLVGIIWCIHNSHGFLVSKLQILKIDTFAKFTAFVSAQTRKINLCLLLSVFFFSGHHLSRSHLQRIGHLYKYLSDGKGRLTIRLSFVKNIVNIAISDCSRNGPGLRSQGGRESCGRSDGLQYKRGQIQSSERHHTVCWWLLWRYVMIISLETK